MANTWLLGRTGKVFVKPESAYGTAPTFVATDAVRHLGVNLHYSPKSRVNSPARFAHPSLMNRYTRRAAASHDLSGLMYPSGTLNTKPEIDQILAAVFGAAAQNVTLAATVSASPTPTVSGATVSSATGLVIGQMVQIAIAAGSFPGVYARRLTGISTLALTWEPDLPAAPAAADTVKGCVTYNLATALGSSLDIAHYPASGTARELLGCAPDTLEITLDSNDEPRFKVSGPAKAYASSPQAAPGSFTTVGAENPPSGLTGALYVGGVAVEFLKAVLTIKNGIDLQNNAFGTSAAQAMYRKTKRSVELAIDTMVSDQTTLWTAGVGTTDQKILLQVGTASGAIWAFELPAVEFELPDTPDADETNQWSFKGVAKGSAAAGNDEVTVGCM
jgi:hypothetical protein